MKLKVVLEPSDEGGYTVYVHSLAGCISEGDTFKEAKKNITEAIVAYLGSLALDGEPIPDNTKNIIVEEITESNRSIPSTR